MYETDQDSSFRQRDPNQVVQHHGGHAEQTQAAPSSGHASTDRPRRPQAHFPHGPHSAGSERRPLDRHSLRSSEYLPALEALTALSRAPAREGARDSGKDLL